MASTCPSLSWRMRRSLRALKSRIDLWDKAAIQSEIGEMDPEIEAGLRALGYFD